MDYNASEGIRTMEDITERKITKIAREAEKLVLKSLSIEGIGTAEIDFIHALRHHPGVSQSDIVKMLSADKAAVARRTASLEAKGYLVRKSDPSDKRSSLLYPTRKAEELKLSKVDIESGFYAYLLSDFSNEEKEQFASLLHRVYEASKKESRQGFPHFLSGKKD